MFSALDIKTKCRDISDHILAFLPLRFLEYESTDLLRIYRPVRGFAGHFEPTFAFRQSVWEDRLSQNDASPGTKLHALRFLRKDEVASWGRPRVRRADVLVSIFEAVRLPSHALCNKALLRLIRGHPEDMLETERSYLALHFCSELLPSLHRHFQEGTRSTTALSGLGDLYGEIICAVCLCDHFKSQVVETVSWVLRSLDQDEDKKFRKLVLLPFSPQFEKLFVKLESSQWNDSGSGGRAAAAAAQLRLHLFHPRFCF